MTAARLIIEGRVQGVWYRGWMAREAATLDLRGWVRNRTDGHVEALLIGDKSAIENMTERCRAGPKAAAVSSVVAAAATDDGSIGFRQETTL